MTNFPKVNTTNVQTYKLA